MLVSDFIACPPLQVFICVGQFTNPVQLLVHDRVVGPHEGLQENQPPHDDQASDVNFSFPLQAEPGHLVVAIA